MEKVLELLCEIEDKANTIINNASSKKNILNEELKQKMDALDRQYATETESKLNEIRQKMEKEISDEHTALVSSCEARLKELDINFEKNREAYVQTIFENIIREEE